MKNKILIGRTEYVDFPEFLLERIPAKVDTGAYTSSLHCTKITERQGLLSFILVHQRDDKQLSKTFSTGDYKLKKVKSSNGLTQLRYVIKTNLQIFGKKYKTEFSLTDRSKMKYPVLLGRKLLKDRFIVDVSKKFSE